MKKFYCTFGVNHKYSGFILVVTALNIDEASEKAFNHTNGGKYSYLYQSLEEIYEEDKKKGILEVI